MKNQWKFPTSFRSWGPEEYDAIQRVIASDWYTYGPEVAAFEGEIAAFHGRKFAIMTNSGSSAVLIALASLFYVQDNPLQRGDWAATPAIAWSTSWSPLMLYGLKTRLLDCDSTWNAEYGESIGPARVIFGIPILGNPAYMPDWESLARNTGSYFVEDACESLGASINGRLCGTFGDVSALSLYMSHQIAGLESGVVMCDSEEIYRILRMLRSHGWTRDTEKAVDFSDEYKFILPSYNCRPMEIHAAVAREQLKKLPRFIAARRENLEYFVSMTANYPIVHQRTHGETSPFGLAFTVESKEIRAKLAAALRANGIDCRLPTGGSFKRHPMAKFAPETEAQQTPNADRIHDTGMFLGNAPFEIFDQIDRAVKVLEETL